MSKGAGITLGTPVKTTQPTLVFSPKQSWKWLLDLAQLHLIHTILDNDILCSELII